MAVSDDRGQNFSGEAALPPFSSIACFAVIITLSGAACGWLTQRKGRSQVTPTQHRENLVMAASKHGIARCVPLSKPSDASFYSPGDIWSVSTASFANGVVPSLPAIFVTPPSPPTSVTSIGSCGDLLLVDDDMDNKDEDKSIENHSASSHGSIHGVEICVDLNRNLEEDKEFERNNSLDLNENIEQEKDCEEHRTETCGVGENSIETSDNIKDICHPEVNSNVNIVVMDSNGENYTNIEIHNGSSKHIHMDVDNPSGPISFTSNAQPPQEPPTVIICSEPETELDQHHKVISNPQQVSTDKHHRPDFTDVFPVDEFPMADESILGEPSCSTRKGLGFPHISHIATNNHFLSPSSAQRSRSGPSHSSHTPHHHHHHHHQPIPHHLQHLQHLFRGNGHHQSPNYHYQQQQQQQHLHDQHHHQHPTHLINDDHHPQQLSPLYTSNDTTCTNQPNSTVNSKVSEQRSPHIDEISPQTVNKNVHHIPDITLSVDSSPCTQSNSTGQSQTNQQPNNSGFLEDDDDFDLEQYSPRPRLSSMEPGTRKTDFKFRRAKKLTS